MKIIVYGKQSCKYCNMAKEWLTGKNLSYTYIDVLKDINTDQLKDLKAQYNMNTVPIVVINDKLIGGYSELVKTDL